MTKKAVPAKKHEIVYVKGDLFAAIAGKRKVIIPHICNDVGAWGAGFVIPLGRRYPQSRETYLALAISEPARPWVLGTTQVVGVDKDNIIFVANMIAQHDVCLSDGRPPVRYFALATCMDKVAQLAAIEGIEIHAPKFGAGLAGGNWDFIATLIQEIWIDRGIPVTIYSLE